MLYGNQAKEFLFSQIIEPISENKKILIIDPAQVQKDQLVILRNMLQKEEHNIDKIIEIRKRIYELEEKIRLIEQNNIPSEIK
jgi:hypothetical protein